VAVGGLDADVELGAAKPVEFVETLLKAAALGRDENPGAEIAAQVVEELALELGAQGGGGKEEVVFRGDPDALRAQGSGGDEEVQVGMEVESLAPTLKGGDRAGQTAEPFGVREEVAQAFPCRAKEQVGEVSSVVSPEVVQLLGDGEDDLVVATGQRAGLLGLDPFFGFFRAAQRAASVPTGVVANDFVMSFGTFVHVGSLGGGTAGSDVECSPPFAPTELVTSSVRVEVIIKNLPHEADHVI